MVEIKAIDKDTIQVTSNTAHLEDQSVGCYNLSLPETDHRVVIGWVDPTNDRGVYQIECTSDNWGSVNEVYLATCKSSFLEDTGVDIVSDREASYESDGSERDAYEVAEKMNAALKYALENVL